MTHRRTEEPDDEGGSPLWMSTFGDLMSLLLTFFALLVSFTDLNSTVYRELAGSLGHSLTLYQMNDRSVLVESVKSWMRSSPRADADRKNEEDMEFVSYRQVIDAPLIGVSRDVDARLVEKGVLPAVRIPVFFPAGGTELSPGISPLLEKVVVLFRDMDFNIQIQGYADDLDRQYDGTQYRKEFSGKRAVAVARYLIEHGIDAERVAVAACSDYRTASSRLVRDNDLPRQVEIVVLKD